MTPSGVRVRLAILGLGFALALGIGTPATPAAPPARAPKVMTIYNKSRSFRVPFNIDATHRARLKEVRLAVSEDFGNTWKPRSIATPDRPSFTFRASRDAEYWFAVQTVDMQGRTYPGDDDPIEPKLKVVVDTAAPSVVLEPDGRRGSIASVRWELRDEHLDLKTLALEYKVEGAREWRSVPITRRALIGSESWDAHTAEPVQVRATVADKAGNTAEATVSLPEGTAPNPGQASSDSAEFSAPPPISQPPVSQISSGPSYPPAEEAPRGGNSGDGFTDQGSPPNPATEPDAFSQDGGPAPASPPENGGGSAAGQNRSILVQSPRFPLKYAVDDAGENGPNVVELWVTQDNGRTWIRRAEDSDRVSPFPVDLGGEGRFGLCLVARSASGLGESPPAPGDPPQYWVEVDSTPPTVQFLPIGIGKGSSAGKIRISWRAQDLHLGARPVTLSWRPDQPGSPWKPITPEPIENSGRYVWTVPLQIPPRFHVRIDVVDEAGNRAFADTTETGPVVLDRARPKSRILGLDPSAQAGQNPPGRAFR